MAENKIVRTTVEITVPKIGEETVRFEGENCNLAYPTFCDAFKSGYGFNTCKRYKKDLEFGTELRTPACIEEFGLNGEKR